MYFFTTQGTVCHILEDEKTGRAPAPCGSRVSMIDLISLHAGKLTSQIIEKKPAEIPLCKHCRKAEAR
jgi:hypothetical protein